MINAEEVERVFLASMFDDGEPTDGYVEVHGIMSHVGFHPQRLQAHAGEINAWLDQLPDAFQEKGGGGMSFLNACMTASGEQWTGLHERMDQLFMLGMGIGRVKCLLPRSMWSALPGGMPYYVVRDAVAASVND